MDQHSECRECSCYNQHVYHFRAKLPDLTAPLRLVIKMSAQCHQDCCCHPIDRNGHFPGPFPSMHRAWMDAKNAGELPNIQP